MKKATWFPHKARFFGSNPGRSVTAHRQAAGASVFPLGFMARVAVLAALGGVCLAAGPGNQEGPGTAGAGERALQRGPDISAQPAGAQGTSSFTTIDVTGAGTGAQQGTAITSIDSAGDVTGVYVDANNVKHGFVLPAGGSITTFDAESAAGLGAGQGTIPSGINSSGTIVGTFVDANHANHGFVRAATSPYTVAIFDAPGAPTTTTERGTSAMSINDSGVIVGFYTTGTYLTNSVYHGFQRTANGTITNIDDPNAGSGNGPGFKQGTSAYGINASGEIVGTYTDSSFAHHGFLLVGDTYTVVDPPGVGLQTCINSHGKNFGGTSARAIDPGGDIVGSYLDTSCSQHGFIRTASGTYSSFDAPGADLSPCSSNAGAAETFCGTGGFALDGGGDITGGFFDTDGIGHGFLRAADTGTITTFSDPNAGTTGLAGTLGVTIRTTSNGIQIAGVYVDTDSVLHGFIYAPVLTSTTTTLTPAPTPNPSVYQEPVTLSATVSSTAGAPPNGENVTFMSGTTSLGTATLTSGVASLTTTSLPVGTDSITAVYGGDSDFSGSTSAAVSQTVNKASSSTTLKSSLNPSVFGQSVTFTANVSGQFGGVATGAVTFSNGNTSLGTVALSGNAAVITSTALPQGTDTITAVYSGDSNFAASTSNTVSQVVTGALPGGNEWTWLSGSSTVGSNGGQSGVYGTLGKAAAGNVPGGRQGAVTWTDKSGNLWLFGGVGFDSTSASGSLNDLWEFNLSTNQWAWMSGSSTVGSNGGQSGVYGTLGTPATGNVPGGRGEAVSWTDSSGHLWLFGGQGFDAAGRNVFLNDIWEFNISTLEWTWMGGSGTITCALPSPDYCGQPGVYGTKGTAAAGNIPGGRYSATAATDGSGHFWLFGGYGYGAGGACCYLNDLWEFNPATNLWTWVSGGSGGEQNGVYGTLGTPASGNVPGSRYYASSWMDSGGHLWLFGGYGFDANYTGGYLDDQWEFNPSTKDWVWTGGSSAATCWASEACPQTAVYGTLGVPAGGNTPGDRSGANSWTDGSGNLWLFGNLVWHANGSGGYVFNYLNDLWEFNPATKEWTWMGGSGTPNQRGVYGTLGTPAAGNVPGSRYFASNWIDNSGHLLVFGGSGYDANGTLGNLNDLWRYQPATVAGPPAITTQPVSQTVADGSTATFSVTATGTPTLTYQWQYLSGSTWKPFGAGTGYNSATLTTVATTAAFNGLQFRVVVTDGNSLTTTSDTVKLTVGPAITAQPVNQTVIDGSTATFSVAAAGVPTLSYQWQYLSGSTWKAFGAGTGYTTATLTTVATTAAFNGLQFRVVVTDGDGLTATSNAVKLTVGPAITTQPVSQTVADGSTATFSVAAAGVPTLSYQWQYLSGATWKPFGAGTGYTTATLTTVATTAAFNGLQFRVVVTDGDGLTATSNTVKLTVGPAITTQPVSQTVTDGSAATFSVAAAGVPTLSYQWQYLSGSNWKPFGAGTGYTTATLTTVATTAAFNGLQFRVVVTDGNGLTATSNTVKLTVGPAITTQPVSQTVAAGSTATFNVAAAGVPTLTYQWQYLSGTTWKPFGAGTGYTTATLTTFATTAAFNGLQFRVVVTDGDGLTATSNTATLTVH